MKKGDRIILRHKKPSDGCITVGRVYIAHRTSENRISVIDNCGHEQWFDKSQFKPDRTIERSLVIIGSILLISYLLSCLG